MKIFKVSENPRAQAMARRGAELRELNYQKVKSTRSPVILNSAIAGDLRKKAGQMC